MLPRSGQNVGVQEIEAWIGHNLHIIDLVIGSSKTKMIEKCPRCKLKIDVTYFRVNVVTFNMNYQCGGCKMDILFLFEDRNKDSILIDTNEFT